MTNSEQTQNNWDQFLRFLSDKNRLLITTHLNPDGDALGSQIAVAAFCRYHGKKVKLINVDITPRFFRFLDQKNEIEQYEPDRHNPVINECDGGIVVDVSEWQRIGRLGDELEKQQLAMACIDHHIYKGNHFDAYVIRHDVSSTGELVYDLFAKTKTPLTQPVLDALYTSLLTDTGSFRFSNTTSKTHKIVADLLQKGADFSRVYHEIYESDSPARTRLKGRLLSDIRYEKESKLAWFVLSQELLAETGAEMWESEGFSDLPRSVASVEMSIMFVELKNGECKASFRSKGKIPINDLAAIFGGGGHRYAAGASFMRPLNQVIKMVLPIAKDYFESATLQSS